MIDSYSFGRIVIDGKQYSGDVIIYSDRVDSGWWRKAGHLLHIDDIREIVKEKPDVLVVGTGHSGLMRVLPQTEEYLRSNGIELIAQRTGEACKTYNSLSKTKTVIAALHLTC